MFFNYDFVILQCFVTVTSTELYDVHRYLGCQNIKFCGLITQNSPSPS